jgi:hypothetical protein
MACSLVSPAQYLEAAVASAARHWVASVFLAGLILCLDVHQRKVSLALPIAALLLLAWGFVVYRAPHWQGEGDYAPDCTVPLLQYLQYVLGLTSVLLAYRVFRAIRSK